jgi:hypothetical protein
MSDTNHSLPYTDTKPIGAADFYFAINATFRFILGRAGLEGLRRYWSELGSSYFAPVSERWKLGGLQFVSEYWKDFFRAEPNAEVDVELNEDSVVLNVKVCPVIKQLRDNRREIVPCFCQHCYFVSEAMAAPAGLTVRVTGGNGSCRQSFHRQSDSIPSQDLNAIAEASC